MLFARKVERLERILASCRSLLVALSGGVDSSALLAAAARALPGRVAAATTVSPAVPEEDVAEARAVAARLLVPHEIIPTRELDDPRYVANAGDRCYFCRREMYGRLGEAARALGLETLADGLHAEDRIEDRPGVRAARERGVRHPLREASFTKAEVRRLARAFGLANRDKPAQPCLASRIPTGLAVTRERLARIEAAERAVRALGYRALRVRCEERHARVEVAAEELHRALEGKEAIAAAVRACGFETAAVDPRGYRGSLLE
jgi:uncharacterized protein